MPFDNPLPRRGYRKLRPRLSFRLFMDWKTWTRSFRNSLFIPDRPVKVQAASLFVTKRVPKPVESIENPEQLYSEIGLLKGKIAEIKKSEIIRRMCKTGGSTQKIRCSFRSSALCGQNQWIYILFAAVHSHTWLG